jgi:group I intron endonuclease
MVVYKIINNINGKIYIGCTINFNDRIKRHFSGKYCGSELLHKAVKKYGVSNFSCEIIKYFNTTELMLKAEIEAIKKYNSLIPNGYNIHLGGKGGRIILTKEQLEKRSAHALDLCKKNIGNKYSVGVILGPVAREKISLANKGKKLLDSTKLKISLAKIGNKNAKGCVRSKEEREAISQRMKGAIFSNETKMKMSIAAKNRMANTKRDKLGRMMQSGTKNYITS